MDIQLKRGLLDVCVLAAIKNEESYGYKIMKDVKPYIELSESTLYTILKRLEEKGVLKVENKTVTSLYTKDQIQSAELDAFMDKTFEGSLPAFIAAFGRRQALSEKEIEEIKRSLAENKHRLVIVNARICCKLAYVSRLAPYLKL